MNISILFYYILWKDLDFNSLYLILNSLFSAYPWPGAAVSPGGPTLSSLQIPSPAPPGEALPFQCRPRDIVPPAYNLPGRPLGLPPGISAWNTSPEGHPEGIQNNCQSHLNWPLSMWCRSSYSELLSQSLGERPVTMCRKLFSATCARDLVF